MNILTGIQPTNNLHIGNLFGALMPAVALQETHDVRMMIADYHAITVPIDATELRQNILFITAAYLAAGIDPEKTILFQQSQVAEHTELGWIMQCLASMGEAERMTQFKDKSGKDAARASVGLFSYPMLQAADILLYDAEAVPVGKDQKQHIELTRDLAGRFNTRYGETFVVPEPLIKETGAKILALNDPSKKMSKSAASEKSYISLMDDPEVVTKKIRSAVTDSEAGISYDPEARPGLANLLTLHSLASGESIDALVGKYTDAGMKEVKDDTAEALNEFLAPIRQRISDLLQQPADLELILQRGSERAQEIAHSKMDSVRKRIGLS